LVVEKKSMSFPIVNGMLMETEDEINNNPIATSKGFRSGLASAAIFRKEEAVSGDFLKIEGSRDRIDGFDSVGVSGVSGFLSGEDSDGDLSED
jgi:hypothetical protein